MKQFILILLFISSFAAEGATVNKTLYIKGDSIQVAGGNKLPYLTFNESNSFSSENARIILNAGDDLDLWVVNFDTIVHQFQIVDETLSVSIPVGDSVNVMHSFANTGIFIFNDPTNFPDYASLGLGGLIVVKDHNHQSFYWNVKEHIVDWNSTILSGGSVDWTTYYPDYFTINGKSNPEINNDVDARITGSVGDTLMIYVANTGQSIHPFHFHGYHVEIVYSSRNPEHVGWSKDTHGVYPTEGVVFRLIPDQPGEYPVHDHNLVATTGGNVYPLGMFTTILITP